MKKIKILIMMICCMALMISMDKNSIGSVADDYLKALRITNEIDQWNFYAYQCTSYVAGYFI